MNNAIFLIETKHAAIICDAIAPEGDESEQAGRTHSCCMLTGEGVLELSIQAMDLAALRAALNSWLRLIQVASEMIERTQIPKKTT